MSDRDNKKGVDGDNRNHRDGPDGLGRRDFLRIGALGGLAAGAALQQGSGFPADAAESGDYPVKDIAPLADIDVGKQITFDYPDGDSPAILLRLKDAAQGGIGPGESIVAFSLLCTHKGCAVNYKPDNKLLLCPCHWSSFDPAKAGRLIIGQASGPLPQITLRVTDGTVQAVGVSGLIYGRHTNIV